LDDLDEDGEIDERCATIDLGAGLVVETLCNTDLVPTPEVGVVPTAGSLLLLPSPARWDDLADVDATIRTATTVDGRRVVIYVLGSDTLFDSGSSTLRSTATPPLTAIVASVATRFPDAPISVRGAADSVGEPAANQTLSEQRAAAVAATLTGLGIDPARVSSIGLGEDVPAAEETSDLGRQVNRRVEIVVG
jgi:outer membrane protein OmpA-like peptidoglycan-associated protein